MRQLKLNKFTEQGYRFHQWYPFSVAPHGRHRYKNLWRFFGMTGMPSVCGESPRVRGKVILQPQGKEFFT